MKTIHFPQDEAKFLRLRAGTEVLFSGTLLTARDQAHKRLVRLIRQKKKMPFDLQGQVIYYCGPTKTPPASAIGSCGPTTSSRMDDFTGPLLQRGLLAMVGKGRRSHKVRQLIKKYKRLYCVAPAGCGAFIAAKVISKKVLCFRDLGPEAVCRLEVKDLPLIVAIDANGNSIYNDL